MARKGYTLLELLLVLMLIVVAASIAIPVIEPMLSSGHLSAARDMVRARLADIRGRAMKEGRPYKFSFIENSGKFKIEPEDSSASASGGESPLVVEGELPEKVVFCKSETGLIAEGELTPGSTYETAVIYLGDGTCRDDASNLILFGLQGKRATGFRLRPLTGAVSSVEPTTAEGEP